jgi:hypothetical protein
MAAIVHPRRDTLAARLEALELRVARLEAARRPSPHDAVLREAIADSTNGADFRARDLFVRAEIDPALHAALSAALIESPDQMGSWLRDAAGEHDEIVITRLRGRRWRAIRHIDT